MKPIRVLFLAEDEGVVVPLKDAFADQRECVDAHFVESADLALDMLSKITFDAVVTGVRAHGMDGLTFLRYVKDRHPQIARFVANRDGAADGVQASSGAHQVWLAAWRVAPVAKGSTSSNSRRLVWRGTSIARSRRTPTSSISESTADQVTTRSLTFSPAETMPFPAAARAGRVVRSAAAAAWRRRSSPTTRVAVRLICS